ncbi:hypothetical protein QTH53_01925 [Clostridium perfringens]|uniref:hypothetical protein n=1 Tax=Clostridium perfringens TaxID=1502 RepID=UPI0022485DFD|nr:hypothetical protein [Clostridium perfringens]MCX0397428.1 hypothetical protein [Clostridium perfringens]MDM0625067.1 hypothetical protein [Clostridium perfringens]MDM0673073.1 hypothetical protein [Clostridium perfringens]
MSTRNVYYYCVEIRDVKSNTNVTSEIKKIFNSIFDENTVFIDGHRSLKLQNGNITLDILVNNEKYLFARVGKETEHYNILKRNKATMGAEPVIKNEDINTVLEVCTYFLLDYDNGIVGFIFGKSAPTPNALVNIVTDYNMENIMNITRIASPESVRALLKPGSTIKKVKYVMRTPNIEILEALKIKDKVKEKMIRMEKQEIEIVIKNNNKPMFQTLEDAKEFITTLFESEDKDDISLFGNSGGSRQKEFKFLEQDISYPIEIKEYEMNGNQKVRIDSEIISTSVYEKLKIVYNNNYNDIIRFAGMDYNS